MIRQMAEEKRIGRVRALPLATAIFLSGAGVMSLEIVAFRVLSPFCGNSIYVWGSLISVILAALSVGYYLGGRLADRWPDLRLLSLLVAGAGFLSAGIAQLRRPVQTFVESHTFDIRIDSLFASLTLFLAPSILLGMVLPFSVRVLSREASRLGRTVGALYALSTLGSIFGTLFTAFFLINHMRVPSILLLIGAGLVGCAVLFAISGRAHSVAFLALILLAAPALGAEEKVIFERDTMYHHIKVIDSGGRRFLKFDRQDQSGIYLRLPYRSCLKYADFVHLAMVFQPETKKFLTIGLGGGSVPREFFQDYPRLLIESVELDPVVIKVARRYFFLPRNRRFIIHEADGRRFLVRSDETYDIIFTDAYFAEAMPFHLLTKEFFELVRKRLSPEGVLVSNIIGSVKGRYSQLYRSVLKTIRTVFPVTYTFAVPFSSEEGKPSAYDRRNLIIIALKEGDALSREEIVNKAKFLVARGRLKRKKITEWAGYLVENEVLLEDVPILEDDFAPVDDLMRLP